MKTKPTPQAIGTRNLVFAAASLFLSTLQLPAQNGGHGFKEGQTIQ